MGGLTVVTGQPCAGKTSWVDDHRETGDVVIDVDALAVALGAETDHVDWSSATPHRILARDLRAYLVRTLISDIKRDGPPAYGVWLIDTAPKQWQRAEYRRAQATIVDLDPGREVCHERAKAAGRTVSTHGEIERWYAEAVTR